MPQDHNPRPAPRSYADLLAEKEELRLLIKQKEQDIKERATQMFTPSPRVQASTSGVLRWVGSIDRIFAIYQGVSIGYKVIKQTRKIFGKKR